ncbi:MAG: septation protein IspZ [Alphaproteobacteria bacterium]|nr:septation protein IspZ [Alphaproteobacteria bacterium]
MNATKDSRADNDRAEPSPAMRLATDLGPLIVFFVANAWGGIFAATLAFMIAITVAILVSLIKYRHISPLLWFSGVMVIVLGGITIWLPDETFIKTKPTIY